MTSRQSIFALLFFVAACGGSTAYVEPTPSAPAPCGENECILAIDRTASCDSPDHSVPCTRDGAGLCRPDAAVCPPPPPAPVPCGGMAAAQNSCGEGEFCDYAIEASCGAADATGVCRAIPSACTADHVPVCGCNDQTYANACMAAGAGVSVAAAGPCPERFSALGEACGSRGMLSCGEGLFCDFPAGADCGRSDAPGTCAAIPTTCSTRASRVCGCDRTTYVNACAANLASVSVESRGACRNR